MRYIKQSRFDMLFCLFATTLLTVTNPLFAGAQPKEHAVIEPITINWYHDQEYFQPVIDVFVADTGIPVTVTSDYDTFTTDVIMVSDYKGLLEAKHFKHFRKYDADFWGRMSQHVPAKWRDEGGFWLGFALRIRAALINRDRVGQADKPKTYFDLADPKWRGRMTQRVSSNVYNRSQLAYLIARYGEDKARAWAKGVVANVADGEYLNDVKGALAVAEGKYDIGFSNTYYLGYVRMWYPDDKNIISLLDNDLDISWLDGDFGAFANVTGVGISSWIETGSEKHRSAQRLIEFLLSKKGQELMSKHVHKYPVRADAEPSDYLKSKGSFRLDDFNLNDLRYHYDTADRIMREVGWQSDW